MLILITGGSSSGKSAFGESAAQRIKEKLDREHKHAGKMDAASEDGMEKLGSGTAGENGMEKLGSGTASEDDVEKHGGGRTSLLYIATMEPFSEEARKKIERHHRLRAGKGFLTIERYRDVGGLPDCPKFPREIKPVVLLECMSNLLANEMFPPEMPSQEKTFPEGSSQEKSFPEKNSLEKTSPEITAGSMGEPGFEASICDKICTDVIKLEAASAALIVIANTVSEDGAEYEDGTVSYIRVMEQIQTRLAKKADEVWEVVCGIPVRLDENA